MGSNLRKKMWTFQNAAVALGNGSELTVGVNMVTATVEITGSGTNKIVFEGKASSDSTWYPIAGANLKDASIVSEVSAKGLIYQISLDGLVAFRIRVSEFSTGSVTVKGTIVN